MSTPALLAQLEPLHRDAFGWALHCCDGDTMAAEDILQTAYCRVAQGKAVFGGRSELKTWWLGVVRMIVLEQRRRAFWRLEKLRGWFVAGGRLNEEPAPQGEGGDERIASALAVLPARQREVLHLVFYQNLTISQAAEAMEISVGSARQHYARGKARLRSILVEHEPA